MLAKYVNAGENKRFSQNKRNKKRNTHTSCAHTRSREQSQQSRLLLLSNLHKKFSISSFAFDLIDHQVWRKRHTITHTEAYGGVHTRTHQHTRTPCQYVNKNIKTSCSCLPAIAFLVGILVGCDAPLDMGGFQLEAYSDWGQLS